MVITNHSMANSGTNCSIKVTKKKSSRQTKGKGSRDLKSGLDAKVAENAEKLNRRKLDALKKGIHKLREDSKKTFLSI